MRLPNNCQSECWLLIYRVLPILICGVGIFAVPPPCAHGQSAELPRVIVERDNVKITQSCVVEIRNALIPDLDGNGVIQIAADNLTVEFADHSESGKLIAVAAGTPWDTLTGIGIMIDGFRNVTIRNAHIQGYKIGIKARNADGLILENCNVADGFATRLKSTPEAAEITDWLYPQRNDNQEWVTQYGAGICVENSDNVTIRRCSARRRQNGIILDRVTNSRIYDNDMSFLSGWGLALWRSSDNVISRNAFDFCIRGYSHGVYNRGQDSAGILMFEQNHRNIIAENSGTHGGDGFFGFGGREALGDDWREEARAAKRRATGKNQVDDLIVLTAEILAATRRRGNNDNVLIGNDFSYAAAHGIEMTFSFGNMFLDNRVVENAICGIWGGYSQETWIAGNTFEGNGEQGYGLERGGVNIEHGFRNVIEWNTFKNNKCGVHLWWDADPVLLAGPWAKANERGSAQNTVANNTFDGDELALQLRETTGTIFVGNSFRNVVEQVRRGNCSGSNDPSELITAVVLPSVVYTTPAYEVYGETRPVGARKELRGRAKIIMTEWFPWDWQAPLALRADGAVAGARTHRWTIFNGEPITGIEPFEPTMADLRADWGIEWGRFREAEKQQTLTITGPDGAGVFPYRIRFDAGGYAPILEGVFTNAEWEVRVFRWTVDPREDLAGWYAEAEQHGLVGWTNDLNFNYSYGGPSEVGLTAAINDAQLGGDYYGTIAKTTLPLAAGRWKITTTSDDGIRVTVDGARVIDNWTWHGPTKDTGEFTLAEANEVEILVEHFELDGFAVLNFKLEMVVPE